MWSAQCGPPHNIRLVIISWSIIFMTWEQFFDRDKHLFNFLATDTMNWFHMKCHSKIWCARTTENTLMEVFLWTKTSEFPGECAVFDRSSPSVSREPTVYTYSNLTFNPWINPLIHKNAMWELMNLYYFSLFRGGVTVTRQVNLVLCVTSMNDLMEKRLASMVDRPWARQLWAIKPAFSSARQIASSPSFQFQLGMFSRWAFIT